MQEPALLKQYAKSGSQLFLPLALLLALIIGWTIFWYGNSRQAAAAISTWMEREAELGRQWSCPGQKIGGFPFSITVSCVNPHFQGKVLGETVTGTFRGLHAKAPLVRPGSIAMELDSPLSAAGSGGAFNFSMQWSGLRFEFEIESGPPKRFSVSGSQFQMRWQGGGAGSVEGTIAMLNGTASGRTAKPGSAYDVTISLQQASIPALDNFLATTLPLSAQFEGTVTQIEGNSAAALTDFLEKWRAANGRVDIVRASLTSGPDGFDAKGSIGLDSEHRPQGKLDARFAGLETALRRMNADPVKLAIGQALSGLLGGGKGGARLALPLILSDGFVRIGPFRTNIQIPPLY
ncbi:MAG: DUF2125 domain-containing protein [Beijerinckiaceae bacterium]|nr:DUF2125 domain-containing protein [Beijerinckiaceae bacterium]